MKLSKSERIFLDFITEEMDENNFITNCVQTRDKFNSLLRKVGQESYSESTIHRCFKGLIENNLINKANARGLYQISPLFYFKGSEEKRAKVLRKILELVSQKPINALRRNLIIDKNLFLIQEQEED